MKRDLYVRTMKGRLRYMEGLYVALQHEFPCIHCGRLLPVGRSSSICSACMDPEHFGFARGQLEASPP